MMKETAEIRYKKDDIFADTIELLIYF